MRAIGGSLLLAFFLTARAAAQPAGGPPPGEGGGDERRPGAYASPSGIPDAPVDERFGIPQIGDRRASEPITLPDIAPSPGPFALPALPSLTPHSLPSLDAMRPERGLVLNARLSEGGALIPDGLVWRLFSPQPTPEGRLQLVAVSKGGEAVFDVPPGPYLLHVGYGRAGMTRRIDFAGSDTHETVTIEAGGLRLGAVVDGKPIESPLLTFDIFGEEENGGERRLIADDVRADVVVRLNSGNYHVVSNYGTANAIVRADVLVETGRITDAQLRHHAAELTLKLVREHGSEAIADTAWSIASSQGDIIKESVGAFSTVVLSEGDYVVVAENRDRLFQQEITVVAGQSAEVEILTTEAAAGPPDLGGSGD